MNKPSFLAILIGYSLCCFAVSADEPAPANAGLAREALLVQNEGEEVVKDQGQSQNPTPPAKSDPASDLQKQIADLEAEIKALRGTLEKVAGAEKKVEELKGKLAIVEGDNTALATRLKTLEDENLTLADRVKRLEGDNAALLERTEEFANKMANFDSGLKTQTTAKPAFVKSAVRFHNHEGRALRMNVNGVWHTLQEGPNDIWVPYGPVHIYRYNGAEPKPYIDWKPYKDGYLMEFDVGTAPAK